MSAQLKSLKVEPPYKREEGVELKLSLELDFLSSDEAQEFAVKLLHLVLSHNRGPVKSMADVLQESRRHD